MKAKHSEGLAQSLNQARANARGEHVPELHVHRVEVKRKKIAGVRLGEGLTQVQFAESLGTLRKWESGERTPSGAAARLVRLFAAKPKLVTQTLGINPTATKRRAKSGLVAAE
jgi:putative transcriptional regulator